jgi:hypothetical protein
VTDAVRTENTTRLTYEQLEFTVKQRDLTIEKQREHLRESENENQRLRLILKGMCLDTLVLKVTLSPEIFDRNTFDVVQMLVGHHAKAAFHEIEQRMGAPLQRLRDALLHINYLENHAHNRGLPFKSFERKNATHTPGPWTVGSFVNEPGVIPCRTLGLRSKDAVVALLMFGEVNDENAANAKLISAAPDMLAALQEISAMYQRAWDLVNGGLMMPPESIPRFEDAHKAVRVAISKAISDGADPLLDGDDIA